MATTFLLNGVVALDAGSLGFSQGVADLEKIEHIVLTHSHIDHTGSLPIAIVEVYPRLNRPMRIYGSQHTIQAVRDHLFNNDIWVDFSKIRLLNSHHFSLEFNEIKPRQSFTLDELRFTPIPVTHPVPTLGFIVDSGDAAVVFTSDTYQTDEIWAEANKLPNLEAVFIDCSFPDELDKLAKDSGHLTPRMIAREAKKITKPTRIICVHLKPSYRDQVLEQLKPYKTQRIEVAEIGKIYKWGK
jgi:ribonuclease BN (tRNA processing enzyme)